MLFMGTFRVDLEAENVSKAYVYLGGEGGGGSSL